MSNAQSTIVGQTAAGGAIRKVVNKVSGTFGFQHKPEATQRGSGRPSGIIALQTDAEGAVTGFEAQAVLFETRNEQQLEKGHATMATLAAGGGYIRNAAKDDLIYTVNGEPCKVKWSLMVTAVPLSEIERRNKARAAAKKAAGAAA